MKLELHFGNLGPSAALVERLKDAGAVISGATCYAEGQIADMLHIIRLADTEPLTKFDLKEGDNK